MRASRSPCSRSRPRPPSCSSRRSPPTCSCSRSASAGRFDATNVIDSPAAAVVTPIGHDHAEYLGTTLQAIAGEKAGIFKRGCPAVIAPQDYIEADQTLLAEAERIGAAPILVGQQDFSVHEEGGRLVYQDENGLLDLPRPKLVGRHQYVNAGHGHRSPARGRLRAVRNLRLRGGRAPGPNGRAACSASTGAACRSIAPKDCEIWLDGGHNPDGGRVLAAAMADLRASARDAPLVLIAGMLGTKDSQAFFKNFAGLAREVIAVPIAGQIAARPAEEVAVHRGQRRAHHLDCAERRIGTRGASRLRLGPPAPRADLRLALPRRRGSGGERDVAGVKPKRSSRTAKPIRDRRPNRATRTSTLSFPRRRTRRAAPQAWKSITADCALLDQRRGYGSRTPLRGSGMTVPYPAPDPGSCFARPG